MKIFFSHSSKDKSLVREIKNEMKSFLDIWMDEKELLPGENLNVEIQNNIDNADFLVLYISESSSKSDWVKKEINWSLEKEKKLNRPFLIPILIDSFPIPKELSDKLYLKLNSQSRRDVINLIEDLNEKVFHLVIKYGFNPSEFSKSKSEKVDKNNIKDKGNINTIIDFTTKLLTSATGDELEKYNNIITENSELPSKTLLLLLEDEAKYTLKEIADSEKQMKNDSKELKDEDDNGLRGPLTALKSMSNDEKVKVAKKVIQKILFIKNNNKVISADEGLYLIRKELSINYWDKK